MHHHVVAHHIQRNPVRNTDHTVLPANYTISASRKRSSDGATNDYLVDI